MLQINWRQSKGHKALARYVKFCFLYKKGKNEFLDWLAFQIQKPGIKIRFANILASKNFQIGKGSLWRVIVDCFGEHNTKTIDVDEALDHSKNTYKLQQ